ncbi:hypothetical protein GCM10019059_36220 [Camelimonas fluminis]|uniref:Uncharacterized protein n=1 Tax=Camelimonas fluminis TaxID=1576911 RepID=A0ABV7UH00_9HYPH|nr:hypothetical protein [Camelimonas fluminis]GHE73374.1 hypothetical protein GCM10019059_36220 [Camelimonas fluminis]
MENREFLISGDQTLAWYRDEVLGAEVTGFMAADRVFGQVRFIGLDGASTGEIVLGPFVHMSALVDGFAGYLREMDALDGELVFVTRPAKAGEMPRKPDLPRYRDPRAAFMHPDFATRVLVKAQECLDAGDAPTAPTLRFEKDYDGLRVDDRPYEFYQRAGRIALGAGLVAGAAGSEAALFADRMRTLDDRVASPVGIVVGDGPSAGADGREAVVFSDNLTPIGESKPEEIAAASAFLAKLPRMILTPKVRVVENAVRDVRAPDVLLKVPGAGAPFQSGVEMDWGRLPVEVFPRRLNEVQVLLDAKLRRAVAGG